MIVMITMFLVKSCYTTYLNLMVQYSQIDNTICMKYYSCKNVMLRYVNVLSRDSMLRRQVRNSSIFMQAFHVLMHRFGKLFKTFKRLSNKVNVARDLLPPGMLHLE